MGNNRALSWLIRGFGMVLAVLFGLAAVLYGVGIAFMLAVNNSGQDWFHILLFTFFSLLMVLFAAGVAVVGFQMGCRINRTTVDNFSIVAALVFARLCYGLYPAHWMSEINGYEVSSFFMAFVVFLATYFVLKYVLCRKFELN